VGRPSAIYDEVVFKSEAGAEERLSVPDALVRYLELGVYIETACGAIGIHPATFYNWMARGEEHKLPDDAPEGAKPPEAERVYVDFFEAITRARERGIAWHEVNVRRGAEKDPRLSLEFLARRRRDQYAREVKVKHGGKVKHEVEGDVDERIENLLEGLASRGEAPAPGSG
jgi:transposase-like protein